MPHFIFLALFIIMFAKKPAKHLKFFNLKFLVRISILRILINNMIGTSFIIAHLGNIEPDFRSNRFKMLFIHIHAVSESLYGSLKCGEVDFV